jgi:hemerythrin-like domain-containing protein
MEALMSAVLETLRAEHRNIARLLDALERQIGLFAEDGEADYDVIRGVADYFLEFPDRCHHPKEDAVFARLKEAHPEVVVGLIDLPDDHRAVHERALRFRQGVEALFGVADVSRAAVVAAVREFIAAERRHMRMEESRFFPLAERILTPDDWAGIEASLTQRRDPLFGGAIEARFQRLAETLLGWERESELGGAAAS